MTTHLPATPLLTALTRAAQREQAAFYAPGHKRGQGMSAALADLLGNAVFRADLPELPELDNLFAPTGPLQAAQTLAAQTFGAEATFFLANGSTCGIEAAVLATCGPGEKILIPRNAHRSVWAALVLSGAQPVYLAPLAQAPWDLAWGVTADQVAQALAVHPEIRVVLVVSPSYHGVCADIATIATCVHAHSGILIVDEAHGPHLSFHEDLPPGAIASGADVVIQSTHKVLSALTQAAMLHVQGERLDRERLRQALQMTQSTSPSYLLLASLDAAQAQMATMGRELMAQTLAIAQRVRAQLVQSQPLQMLTPEHLAALPGLFQLDPTRLTVDVSALGITGFTADEYLHAQLGVTVELPTLRQLACILSLGNTEADGDRLVMALHTLVELAPELAPAAFPAAGMAWPLPAISVAPLTPRDAFFAKTRTLPLPESIGHIGADLLCPYPPGIPLLLPGEVITEAAIATLQEIQAAGGVITGNPDPTLQTLRIVDSG